MMNRLSIVLVALFVAVVAAAPSTILTNLQPVEHVRRIAVTLVPLQSISEQKKVSDGIKLTMQILDMDHDAMLNVDELKVVVSMSGASQDKKDSVIRALMSFDHDKNQKLDINELTLLAKSSGSNFVTPSIFFLALISLLIYKINV